MLVKIRGKENHPGLVGGGGGVAVGELKFFCANEPASGRNGGWQERLCSLEETAKRISLR